MDGPEKNHKKFLKKVGEMINEELEEMKDIRPENIIGKCPNCSFPVDKEDKFCEACGFALKREE